MTFMVAFEKREVKAEIIHDFLVKNEHFCTALCSAVRRDKNNIFVITNKAKSSDIHGPEDIYGVIQLDGNILHCLPFFKEPDLNFEKIFISLCRGKRISGIDGELKVTRYLSEIHIKNGYKSFWENEYFLMTKEDDSDLPPPASLLSMGEEIVCCKQEHEDDLLELQKHYLKEEVIPPVKEVSDLYISSSVKSILKNQKVFAIESDGKFVAKVNTNAIGWNWVQIGGVYTDPLYRRNGYSLCLLSTLCRRINKTGRKSVLFVKKKNLPALSLYEKLGFKKSGEFKIVYFE